MKRVLLLVTEDLELISGISRWFDPENYLIKCTTQAQAIEGVMRFGPNLVLWDSTQLPRDYGFLEALRLHSQLGWLPVVLLSESNAFKDRLKALKSGVDVYLGRPFALEEAFAVIEALLAHAERFRQHSNQTQTPRLQAVSRPRVAAATCVLSAPTPSEKRVLQGVAQGQLNKQIARLLNLSLRTVESHISNMLNKTGLSNRTQLARWAVECGYHQEQQALSLVSR